MTRDARWSERRRGILAFDLIAGISLALLILAGFALATSRLVNMQKFTVMQRQVRDAADCALNSLRAGLPDPQEIVRRSGSTFAEEIEIRVQRQPASGEWIGATRVTVEAILDRGDQSPIRAVLSAYVYLAESVP